MRTLVLSCCLLCLIVLPSASALDNPLAQRTDPWAGSFSGDGLTLTLQAAGAGSWQGSISLNGQQFPASATGTAQALQGSFQAGEHRFPFTVQAGPPVVLSSGGSEYRLQKQAPVNPLASGATSAPATRVAGGNAAPVAAGQLTQRYKHELGLTFLHPPGWSVQQPQPGTLVLNRPDVHKVNGQPAEVYYLQGFAAAEVPDLATPAAEAQAQALMTQLAPGFRSDGSATRIPHQGGTVLSMGWSGSNPAVNPPLELGARLWAQKIDAYVICFLVVTPKNLRQEREALAQQIFLSMAYEKPPVDNRLVGSWRNTETYMSGDFSSVTETYLNLLADGQCSMGGRMMASMEHNDSHGMPAGSSSVDSGDSGMSYGKWTFAGNRLTINWRDGSTSSWEVVQSGNSMLLKSGGSKKLYERTR